MATALSSGNGPGADHASTRQIEKASPSMRVTLIAAAIIGAAALLTCLVGSGLLGNQPLSLIRDHLPGYRWMSIAGAGGLLTTVAIVGLVYTTRKGGGSSASNFKASQGSTTPPSSPRADSNFQISTTGEFLTLTNNTSKESVTLPIQEGHDPFDGVVVMKEHRRYYAMFPSGLSQEFGVQTDLGCGLDGQKDYATDATYERVFTAVRRFGELQARFTVEISDDGKSATLSDSLSGLRVEIHSGEYRIREDGSSIQITKEHTKLVSKEGDRWILDLGWVSSLFSDLYDAPTDILASLPILSDLETAVDSISPTLFPGQYAHFRLEVDGKTTVYALWRPEGQVDKVYLSPLDLEEFSHEGGLPIKADEVVDWLRLPAAKTENRSCSICPPERQIDIQLSQTSALHPKGYVQGLPKNQVAVLVEKDLVNQKVKPKYFAYRCPDYWSQSMQLRAKAAEVELPDLFFGEIEGEPPTGNEIFAWAKKVATKSTHVDFELQAKTISSVAELVSEARPNAPAFGYIEEDGLYVAIRVNDKVYTMRLPDHLKAKHPDDTKKEQFNFEGRDDQKMLTFDRTHLRVNYGAFFDLLLNEAATQLSAENPYLDFDEYSA